MLDPEWAMLSVIQRCYFFSGASIRSQCDPTIRSCIRGKLLSRLPSQKVINQLIRSNILVSKSRIWSWTNLVSKLIASHSKLTPLLDQTDFTSKAEFSWDSNNIWSVRIFPSPQIVISPPGKIKQSSFFSAVIVVMFFGVIEFRKDDTNCWVSSSSCVTRKYCNGDGAHGGESSCKRVATWRVATSGLSRLRDIGRGYTWRWTENYDWRWRGWRRRSSSCQKQNKNLIKIILFCHSICKKTLKF